MHTQDEQSDSWILSENDRLLLNPMGIRRKLSESLVLDSDRKSSDIGKYQNDRVSYRNTEISTLSDVRRLPIEIQYQVSRQLPTNSRPFR